MTEGAILPRRHAIIYTISTGYFAEERKPASAFPHLNNSYHFEASPKITSLQ